MDASAARVLQGSNDADAHDRFRQKLLKDAKVAAAFRTAARRAQLIRNLTTLREHLKLSQKEIAQRMGTTQSAISDLEKLRTDPRLSTLERYAEAMGCRLELEIHEDVGRSDGRGSERLRQWLSLVHYRSWRNRSLQYDESAMVRVQSADEIDLWREEVEPGEAQRQWRPPVTVQATPIVSVEVRDTDELGLFARGS